MQTGKSVEYGEKTGSSGQGDAGIGVQPAARLALFHDPGIDEAFQRQPAAGL